MKKRLRCLQAGAASLLSVTPNTQRQDSELCSGKAVRKDRRGSRTNTAANRANRVIRPSRQATKTDATKAASGIKVISLALAEAVQAQQEEAAVRQAAVCAQCC